MQITRTALLFPGQGSQKVGMGKTLSDTYKVAHDTFAEADEILRREISTLAWEGPKTALNDTTNTQPALLVHSVAAWRVLRKLRPNFLPVYTAGHSMGEISALVASETLSFSEALNLAQRRGELMKEAGVTSPGGMAAILGLDFNTLEQICAQASTANDIVQVANDNCPGQVVISGEKAVLDRAMAAAQDAGARRVIPLAVSIAAHSPLMIPAQHGFNQAVAAAPIVEASIPIIGNVSAEPLTTPAEIRSDLQAQLTKCVRWTESIQLMRSRGVDTFIELGSGNVLSGLVRRIDRKATRISLGKPEDFEILITAS
ncbi:MAG: ACP S-malonyltransferase [Chloroflexota bacterium]|nr:ACP S-malonyltransferase [Chloroflexota bacterium]